MNGTRYNVNNVGTPTVKALGTVGVGYLRYKQKIIPMLQRFYNFYHPNL
jgi:hypothetical protein